MLKLMLWKETYTETSSARRCFMCLPHLLMLLLFAYSNADCFCLSLTTLLFGAINITSRSQQSRLQSFPSFFHLPFWQAAISAACLLAGLIFCVAIVYSILALAAVNCLLSSSFRVDRADTVHVCSLLSRRRQCCCSCHFG